jgi:LysR family transcriptional regulator (chromosome initiation inhibitor)
MKHGFIMLDYPSLAAVAAVITEGSFERAAAALGMTPSAVSQRVRGLEERLGAILILRGAPCLPTELGGTLCAHLDKVRLLEQDMAGVLGASVDAAPPTLRVAVNADSLATWFPAAMAAFVRKTGVSLDLKLDDEAYTADRLRSGEVLGAVTTDLKPVQGCKVIPLGALRYVACASPDFVARYFAQGVDGDALAVAPHLRFDRRDGLQARWAREAYGVEPGGPVHWVPSTNAFIDFALEGLGWSMHPLQLVAPELASGALVELAPGLRIDVQLHWAVTRLHTGLLQHLSDAVRAVAQERLVG